MKLNVAGAIVHVKSEAIFRRLLRRVCSSWCFRNALANYKVKISPLAFLLRRSSEVQPIESVGTGHAKENSSLAPGQGGLLFSLTAIELKVARAAGVLPICQTPLTPFGPTPSEPSARLDQCRMAG